LGTSQISVYSVMLNVVSSIILNLQLTITTFNNQVHKTSMVMSSKGKGKGYVPVVCLRNRGMKVTSDVERHMQ